MKHVDTREWFSWQLMCYYYSAQDGAQRVAQRGNYLALMRLQSFGEKDVSVYLIASTLFEQEFLLSWWQDFGRVNFILIHSRLRDTPQRFAYQLRLGLRPHFYPCYGAHSPSMASGFRLISVFPMLQYRADSASACGLAQPPF